MPPNPWKALQTTKHPWSSLPSTATDPENKLPTSGSFDLKQNPTEVGSSFRKAVFEAETINGLIIELTPCRPPNKGLPVNEYVQLKIEHLDNDMRLKFKTLYKYHLTFYLQTSNYNASTGEGRKLKVTIKEYAENWVAVYHDKQVYGITMTCRVFK